MKNTLLKSYGFALAFALSIPAHSIEKTTIDLNPILSSRLSSNKKISEKLSDEADKLLTTYSFMFAYEVYELAIKQDSENFKAQFMVNLLKPYVGLRGIMARMEPLRAVLPKLQKSCTEWLAQDKTNLKDFYLDGRADIKDEEDFRTKIILPLMGDLEKAGLFLKAHFGKKAQFVYYHNDAMIHHNAQSCSAKKVKENVYEMSKCPHLLPRTLQIDSADFFAIQYFIMYAYSHLSVPGSYAMNGIIDIIKDPTNFSTHQEGFEYLKYVPGFGELKDKSIMPKVPGMGIEFLVEYDAVTKRDDVCPVNYEDNPARKDNLAKSVCLPRRGAYASFDALVNKAERAFKLEPNEEMAEHKVYGQYKAKVNYFSLFNKPVNDLKTLWPSKYNSCGNPSKLSDDTLAGTFPNGDATKFMIYNGDLDIPCL